MSCPIVVLDNAYDNYWTDSVTNESKHPMELFAQVHGTPDSFLFYRIKSVYLFLPVSILQRDCSV